MVEEGLAVMMNVYKKAVRWGGFFVSCIYGFKTDSFHAIPTTFLMLPGTDTIVPDADI